MKLSKLKIRNFRGYGASDPDGRWTSIPISDFTAFVGTNSSGKTAAFVALEKLFSSSQYRRNITKNDFHLARGERIEDKDSRELSIEAVFTFGELAEKGKGELTVPWLLRSQGACLISGFALMRVGVGLALWMGRLNVVAITWHHRSQR